MADLPDERIGLYKPAFSYTGIDFFGPLVVKHSKRTRTIQARFKHCGAVFVCLTARAVHLDLVRDLSTDSFLLALIRFMARRGKPKVIWTDNGTNFIGTERELSVLLKDLNQTEIENSLNENVRNFQKLKKHKYLIKYNITQKRFCLKILFYIFSFVFVVSHLKIRPVVH